MQTMLPGLELHDRTAEDGDGVIRVGDGCVMPARGRLVDQESRAFARALRNICDGRGSVVRALCVVTGLSEDAVKSKVMRARFHDDDKEKAQWDAEDARDALQLDEADRRYFAHYYRDSDDPAVREFVGKIHAPIRRNPDWRSSTDAAH